MKMIFRMTMLVVALMFAAGAAQAQSKVGYISSDSLILLMPEYSSADTLIKKREQAFAVEYNKMIEEYQRQAADCDKKVKDPTVSSVIKEMCQMQLQDLEARITKFQTSAQEDLAKYQTELLTPIWERLKKAVADVAKEKGYTYVLDNSRGVILYSSPSDDLMNDVKKKLGIKK